MSEHQKLNLVDCLFVCFPHRGGGEGRVDPGGLGGVGNDIIKLHCIKPKVNKTIFKKKAGINPNTISALWRKIRQFASCIRQATWALAVVIVSSLHGVSTIPTILNSVAVQEPQLIPGLRQAHRGFTSLNMPSFYHMECANYQRTEIKLHLMSLTQDVCWRGNTETSKTYMTPHCRGLIIWLRDRPT